MSEGRFQAIDEKLQNLDQLHDVVLGLTIRLDNFHLEFQQAERQNGYHQRPTSFTKMEFPQFDGQDILFWLWKCERYFNINQTREENKVKMSSIHLDEKTYVWHRAMERRWQGRLPQWDEYAMLLQDRVGSSFESPISKLIHLRQTGSLAAFHSDWDLCTAKIDLPDDYLLDAYISSLKPELEKSIRMFKPRNLLDAQRLARMQEVIFEKSKIQSKWVPSPSFDAQIASVNKSKGQYNYKNTFLPSGVSEKSIQPTQEAKAEAWVQKQSFRPSKILTPEKEEADHQSKPMALSIEPNSNPQVARKSIRTSQVLTPKEVSGHQALSVLSQPMVTVPPPLSLSPASSPTQDDHSNSKNVSLESGSSTIDSVRAMHAPSVMAKQEASTTLVGVGVEYSSFKKIYEDVPCGKAKKSAQLESLDMVASWQSIIEFKKSKSQLAYNFIFSQENAPTRSRLQVWFKGKLVTMLVGSVQCVFYFAKDIIHWSKGCLLRQVQKVENEVFFAYA